MSKSAIKAVEKAQEVIATSTTGAKVNLVGYLEDETIRKIGVMLIYWLAY